MSDIGSIVPISGNFEENKSLMHTERQFHPELDIKFINRAKYCLTCDCENGNKYCDFTFLGKKVYFGEEKILGEVLSRRSMVLSEEEPGNTYPTYRQNLIVPLDDGLPFSSLGYDEEIISFLEEHSDVPNKDIDELEELLKDWRLYENGWFVIKVADTLWHGDDMTYKKLYGYLTEGPALCFCPKVINKKYICLNK
jgi:hypothetical protein